MANARASDRREVYVRDEGIFYAYAPDWLYPYTTSSDGTVVWSGIPELDPRPDGPDAAIRRSLYPTRITPYSSIRADGGTATSRQQAVDPVDPQIRLRRAQIAFLDLHAASDRSQVGPDRPTNPEIFRELARIIEERQRTQDFGLRPVTSSA